MRRSVLAVVVLMFIALAAASGSATQEYTGQFYVGVDMKNIVLQNAPTIFDVINGSTKIGELNMHVVGAPAATLTTATYANENATGSINYTAAGALFSISHLQMQYILYGPAWDVVEETAGEPVKGTLPEVLDPHVGTSMGGTLTFLQKDDFEEYDQEHTTLYLMANGQNVGTLFITNQLDYDPGNENIVTSTLNIQAMNVTNGTTNLIPGYGTLTYPTGNTTFMTTNSGPTTVTVTGPEGDQINTRFMGQNVSTVKFLSGNIGGTRLTIRQGTQSVYLYVGRSNGGFADSDTDGVQDAADNCPNTPTNVQVDGEGCSKDQRQASCPTSWGIVEDSKDGTLLYTCSAQTCNDGVKDGGEYGKDCVLKYPGQTGLSVTETACPACGCDTPNSCIKTPDINQPPFYCSNDKTVVADCKKCPCVDGTCNADGTCTTNNPLGGTAMIGYKCLSDMISLRAANSADLPAACTTPATTYYKIVPDPKAYTKAGTIKKSIAKAIDKANSILSGMNVCLEYLRDSQCNPQPADCRSTQSAWQNDMQIHPQASDTYTAGYLWGSFPPKLQRLNDKGYFNVTFDGAKLAAEDFNTQPDPTMACPITTTAACQPIRISGSPEDKINIVFIGDHFTDFPSFASEVKLLTKYDKTLRTSQTDNATFTTDYGLLDIEPWKSNQDKINIWAMDAGEGLFNQTPRISNDVLDSNQQPLRDVISKTYQGFSNCPAAQIVVVVSRREFKSYTVPNYQGTAITTKNFWGVQPWGGAILLSEPAETLALVKGGPLLAHLVGRAAGLQDEAVDPRNFNAAPQNLGMPQDNLSNCAQTQGNAKSMWGTFTGGRVGYFLGCGWNDEMTGIYSGSSTSGSQVRPMFNTLMRDANKVCTVPADPSNVVMYDTPAAVEAADAANCKDTGTPYYGPVNERQLLRWLGTAPPPSSSLDAEYIALAATNTVGPVNSTILPGRSYYRPSPSAMMRSASPGCVMHGKYQLVPQGSDLARPIYNMWTMGMVVPTFNPVPCPNACSNGACV